MGKRIAWNIPDGVEKTFHRTNRVDLSKLLLWLENLAKENIGTADKRAEAAVVLSCRDRFDPDSHHALEKQQNCNRISPESGRELNFDVNFPAGTGTMLSVSLELLQPGTTYIGEVLAVEESGNQTITELGFTTAN